MRETIKPTIERGTDPRDEQVSRKIERETPNKLPIVTAYVIRHGETTENKLDPKRGLTKKGEEQVDEAAEKLISELNPQRDVIQLLDSGNYRANATVMRIAERLKSAGFLFFQPIRTDKAGKLEREQPGTTDNPRSRSYKRIEAANIPDSFKKRLSDPELHKKFGIPEDIPDKRVATWFMMNEEGMENPEQVTARIFQGIESSQKQVSKVAEAMGPGKRIVTIAAGNGSMIDSMVTHVTGIRPLNRGGETDNCEGFKVDFNLTEQPEVKVWGKKIEREV